MKAKPDEFVVLAPAPWETPDPLTLREAFEEYWQDAATVSWDGDSGTLVDGEVTIHIFSDPPEPELKELSHAALEPFGASEVAMLQNHLSVTRLVATGGSEGARAMMRACGALIVAGASAIFLPNCRRLHSPRTVRRLTMELTQQNVTNFFVAAFDRDGWMRTRGLTAFQLPEVETPVNSGMNDAYFRLMDISAAMIAQNSAFAPGRNVQIGPKIFQVTEGPRGPIDDDIPINGMHGVLTLV